MIDVRQTKVFADWFGNLRDTRAKDRIVARIRRLELGNFGDAKFFDGLGELRIDYGPGYRLYLVRRGDVVVILLCGGDKRSQRGDIDRAKAMRDEL